MAAERWGVGWWDDVGAIRSDRISPTSEIAMTAKWEISQGRSRAVRQWKARQSARSRTGGAVPPFSSRTLDHCPSLTPSLLYPLHSFSTRLVAVAATRSRNCFSPTLLITQHEDVLRHTSRRSRHLPPRRGCTSHLSQRIRQATAAPSPSPLPLSLLCLWLTFPVPFCSSLRQIWGAGTASYQIEGAVKQDGREESIWDRFSHTPNKTAGGDTGDVADNSYNLWPLVRLNHDFPRTSRPLHRVLTPHPLSLCPVGHRADEGDGSARLPILSVLVAHYSRQRFGESGRHRPLQRAHQRPSQGRHHSLRHSLPLGQRHTHLLTIPPLHSLQPSKRPLTFRLPYHRCSLLRICPLPTPPTCTAPRATG